MRGGAIACIASQLSNYVLVANCREARMRRFAVEGQTRRFFGSSHPSHLAKHRTAMTRLNGPSSNAAGLTLGLLLSSPPFLPCAATDTGGGLGVQVYDGPTTCANNDADPNEPPTRVVNDYVVGLHFTVTVDESSKAGEHGAKIESSLDRGIAASFPVGQGKVIPGLDQGLVGLCKGSKAHIVIPPRLAYGDIGVPNSNVPGGATLRYDVEILDIKKPSPNDFALIDQNNDGKLSKEEAKAYFDSKGQMIDLEALFKEEDKDGSGYVDWEEFSGPKGDGPPDIVVQEQRRRKMQNEQAAKARAAAQQQQAQAQEAQQQVSDIFQQMDGNGDGKISKEELAAAFVAMGSEMTKEFWEGSDVDGDGFVDFNEFVGDAGGKTKSDEL